MNVSLTPELENFIDERVKTGMYQTASEVVREALRVLKEREMSRAEKIEELRRELDIGIAAADAGRVIPIDKQTIALIKSRGEAKLRARKKKAG